MTCRLKVCSSRRCCLTSYARCLLRRKSRICRRHSSRLTRTTTVGSGASWVEHRVVVEGGTGGGVHAGDQGQGKGGGGGEQDSGLDRYQPVWEGWLFGIPDGRDEPGEADIGEEGGAGLQDLRPSKLFASVSEGQRRVHFAKRDRAGDGRTGWGGKPAIFLSLSNGSSSWESPTRTMTARYPSTSSRSCFSPKSDSSSFFFILTIQSLSSNNALFRRACLFSRGTALVWLGLA